MIYRYNFSEPESSVVIDDKGLLVVIYEDKIYGGILKHKNVKSFIENNSTEFILSNLNVPFVLSVEKTKDKLKQALENYNTSYKKSISFLLDNLEYGFDYYRSVQYEYGLCDIDELDQYFAYEFKFKNELSLIIEKFKSFLEQERVNLANYFAYGE